MLYTRSSICLLMLCILYRDYAISCTFCDRSSRSDVSAPIGPGARRSTQMTVFAAHDASVSSVSEGFPLSGIDAVVFAVGNARQAAYYYAHAFGMTVAAYRGPETGSSDEAAYVLVSGSARFVFRGPVRAGTDLGPHGAAHGDVVIDLPLGVPSAEAPHAHPTRRRAPGLPQPPLRE